MKRYLLILLLGGALVAPATAQAKPKPPPPPTEVYATASDRTPLEWTVYTPTGKGPWPAVIVIHGGFFYAGDMSEAGVATCARDLAAAGYVAFSINYRLAPPGSLPGQKSLGHFPDQPNDVHLAVAAARNDARSNGRVGVVGGSAGATHAAWVAATGSAGQDRADVAVCLSGAYDLSDFSPDPQLKFFIDVMTNYVGVPSTNLSALRDASPAWVVDKTVAPLFLLDTVGDLMPAVQLDDMVAALDALKVRNYEALSIPGALHSFAFWPQIKNDALDFLGAVLNSKGR